MEETRMRPGAVGELVFVLGRHEPRARSFTFDFEPQA